VLCYRICRVGDWRGTCCNLLTRRARGDTEICWCPADTSKEKVAVKMRLRCLWAVLLIGSSCFAQPKKATVASLTAPKNWAPIAVRIFPELSDKVQFTLGTSWIPGEKSKGSMRYKLTARRQPDIGIQLRSEGTDFLLRNVSRCAIFVNLYDADEFLVRSIPVHFDFVVDESIPTATTLISELNANSAIQLSADEYRLFVHGGSWKPSWEGCTLSEVK
jgi:hypothetical protein